MTRRQRSTLAIVIGILALTVLSATVSPAQNAPRTLTPEDRFDMVVRQDFFAGFAGDGARLARGMKACEEALAANPDHAAALVWHGGGLMFMAGQAARQQDFLTARERATRGREEMDRAYRLAPDSLNVMLIRAVVLNGAAPNVRDPARGREMQQESVAGFEKALTIQTPYLGRMSEHSRGELFAGLAEGWSRLGETDKARSYLERMVKELPDSRYQARARAWLEDGPQSGPLTCLTCHRD